MSLRVLFLFSDMGGGHRATATAIRQALVNRYGSAVETALVDGLKEMPYPFNRLSGWYPRFVRYSQPVWGPFYRATNRRRFPRAVMTTLGPHMTHHFRRLVRDHPADVIVSTHPFLVTGILRSLPAGANRPRFVGLVGELVSAHALWYDPAMDLCCVPTEPTRDMAVRFGVAPEKIRLTGLPVDPRFAAPLEDRAALRARLGWATDRPAVLAVGGGDGMGPLADVAQAISASGLKCSLAVVAGRNAALRSELEAVPWRIPARVYGFATNMADLMRAADVLVTKAGSVSVAEGLSAGTPLILYARLPGQEEGNVGYVTDSGAGLYAPGPERVVVALRTWIGPQAVPQALERAAANARRLGRPGAADEIARLIWEMRLVSKSVPR